MSNDKQQPQDVLRDEILADANRQAERALQRARKEVGEITEAAATKLDAWRTVQLDLARAEAQHRADLVLAGLPVEIGRIRANRIETLLQSIREEARQRLDSREGLDERQMLVNLAVDAIRGLGGTRFTLVVLEADRSLIGDGEIATIRQLAGRPNLELEVIGDPQSREGGLMVIGSGGEEVWDNRVFQRLERLWPAMRREIALHTALMKPHKLKTGDTP